MNKILIIFDYDETLVHSDGRLEEFSSLEQLRDLGTELCIASRNDRYYMENQLSVLSISDIFTFVMADFRPKIYQIKHILWNYQRQGMSFDKIIFVDDHEPNIKRVRKEIPEVNCIQFGFDIQSVDELIVIVQSRS